MASRLFLTLSLVALGGVVQRPTVDTLRGVKGATVVVETLPADAARCDIDATQLESVTQRTLLDGGLRVEDNANLFVPTAYVNVNVHLWNSACIANVLVEVQHFGIAFLTYQQPPGSENSAITVPGIKSVATHTVVKLVLFSNETLMTGEPATFGPRVYAVLREDVDQFVTNVKLQNQPK